MGVTRRKDGRAVKSFIIDGVPKYFYSKEKSDAKAEKDIMRQLLAYQGEIERGKTVKEVAEEWEEWHSKRVEESTTHRYKACVRRVIEWFEGKHIKDITVIEANRCIERFALLYPMKKTVKQQKSVCKQIWDFAIVRGYIDANNIWQYVQLPKGLGETKRQPPSAVTLKKVFDTPTREVTKGMLFVNILLFTGIRRGEILGLDYSDIDRDTSFINVNRQVTHISNAPIVKPYLKTRAGERGVILAKKLEEIIPKKKKGFIFCNDDGSPLTQKQFEALWKDAMRELGIEETVTPHQFRHAYASMLHESGVDEKDAQVLLGHADVHTTKQIYMHVSKRRLESVAEKINSYRI